MRSFVKLLFRLFLNLELKPSTSSIPIEIVHSMANDFIKSPNFEGLTFISLTHKLSYTETHHLRFISNGRVKWCMIIKNDLGMTTTKNWVGNHIVNSEIGLITFQFETLEWFHLASYRYNQENILHHGTDRLISLVPDRNENLKFKGPCGKNGEPHIRNLYRKKFHFDFFE